jgi:dipeptidyl aminopeptidase/acylaminoacyl peptidase
LEVGKLEAGTYAGFSLGGDATAPVIAAGWGSAVSPTEIGRVDAASGQWRALSDFNAARAAQIDWQPLQEFWFDSKRGRRIHNFVVVPPGFDASRKYPLFVLIHGGPHNMYVDEFGTRWNYHLHSRPGYVVLLTNYSGSTGFGEAFSRGIQGDPLQGPADEINQAADEAIRRFSFIDGSKQVAGGASYGGHLSNWLAVTTSRYRAIASHAGLYDLKTQWTTSDVVYDRERTLGGPAWASDLAVWHKQSPFHRSTKLGTPMLLTVGEKDFRVPLNNTLESWMVLQRQGVPSRLVVFPDENHWVLKGENSRYHYQVIQDWFAKYLQ